MAETLGRYELIAEIGRGGMADVKLAVERVDDGIERLLVLKVLHDELAEDDEIKKMFRDEAKLSAQIKHPNVVEVYEHGEADGKSFIAMEYLEGEPLLAVLDKGITGQKRLDALSMARIIANTALGLEAAHEQKLVHHDVSLGNIFVLNNGTVKLLDFGVAKASRKSAKQSEKIFGKLAYMAPEKLDERPGDKRSDIWSLGCVLWEGLTYKRLFKGSNAVEIMREVRYVNVPAPSTVNKDVPPELDPIALKCLLRDPSKRYQSAEELAAAIEEVLTAKQYPEKNFKIATYMMQTFHDLIVARERVIKEVAGPDRPSAEVIEAAFSEKAPRESSLPMFDVEALLDGANPVVLPEGSTGADSITPPTKSADDENPFEDAADTVFDDVPANAEASRSLRYKADPSWIHTPHGKKLEELQRAAQEAREHPDLGRRRRQVKYLGGAIGGVLVLVIMIAGIKSCGGDKKSSAPVAKPSDVVAAIIDAAVAPTPPPIDAAEVAVAIDASEEVQEEIEMPVEDASKPERPKPTKSAPQLYAEGLAAWKKNDAKTAYALFTDGRRADSKYANNWYGLGLVHEKAGRKTEARNAYERYLKLAPNAPNGNKLRDHIKKNLL